MARIPTTEFCPTCEAETPKDVLAKAGRVQTRVFQDLDTGKYECAKGHAVDLGPAMEVEVEIPGPLVVEHPLANARLENVTVFQEESQESNKTAVAVEDLPQRNQAQIVPGSLVRRKGGEIEMRLIVPEQFSEPLLEYCRGLGQEPEEYVNQVISTAFENGWFL
jgi:hypothetical protein